MLELFVLNPGPRYSGVRSADQGFIRKPRQAGAKTSSASSAGWARRNSGTRRASGAPAKKGRRRKSSRVAANSRKSMARARSRARRPARRRRNPSPRGVLQNRSRRRNQWYGQPMRHSWARKYGTGTRKTAMARKRRRSAPKRRRARNPWVNFKVPARRGRAWRSTSKGRFSRPPVHRRKRNPVRRRRRNYLAPGAVYNPVLPYMAYNPRGRKRRGGRRYRRNAILPYMAYNPGNPIEALTGQVQQLTNINFWTQEILPLAGGFIGTGVVAGMARKLLKIEDKGIMKHVTNAGGAVILGAGTALLLKDPKLSARVFAGGLVYTLYGILSDVLKDTAIGKTLGFSGLGDDADDLTEELKRRIAESVQEEIQGEGVSDFLTTQNLEQGSVVEDFLTEQALQTAPVQGGPISDETGVMDLEDVMSPMADAMLV